MESTYSQIELSIIAWSLDGTRTAGDLTREIIQIIKDAKLQKKGQML